jgi:phosphoserine phosphatase SerB
MESFAIGNHLDFVLIVILNHHDSQGFGLIDDRLRELCGNFRLGVHLSDPQTLCYVGKDGELLEQHPAALKYQLGLEYLAEPHGALHNELRTCLDRSREQILCDLFLFTRGDYEYPKYLACFDMDSCLISNECINEMGKEADKEAEVQEITHKAMIEGLDFAWSLSRRLALIRGLSSEGLDRCWRRMRLNPGAPRLIYTLKSALGMKTALISSGFTYFSYTVAQRLGIDYAFSNVLEIEENKITGNLVPVGSSNAHILDGRMKEAIMMVLSNGSYIPFCKSEKNTLAVGDGANDQFMVASSGLGVAFHSKCSALLASTYHHLGSCSLDAIPFLFSNCPNQIYIPDVSEELELGHLPCKNYIQ